MMRDVVAILPALNEQASAPIVIAGLRAQGIERIILVDNGSTDATAAVSRSAGAVVVPELRRGYGSAMLAGLAEVERRWPQTSIVLFVDADAADDPTVAATLVQPIGADEVDFVVGSRITGLRERGALTPQSYLGNGLACGLIRWMTGVRFTDLGPFRAIRRSTLQQLEMVDVDFGWTVEMQLKAARAGVRCLEVPVPYRRRIGRSKISGTILGSIKAGYKILYTLARYRRWRPTPGVGVPQRQAS